MSIIYSMLEFRKQDIEHIQKLRARSDAKEAVKKSLLSNLFGKK